MVQVHNGAPKNKNEGNKKIMERVSLKEKMLKEGKFLIDNTFTTDRGIYRVRIILFEGNLFFHKMKNGEIVEVQNINKLVNK